MTSLQNRLVLHRFICREFGCDDMREMLDPLREVPAGFNAGGESEYASALYLPPTAQVRAEELVQYDANGDHILNARMQPNELGQQRLSSRFSVNSCSR